MTIPSTKASTLNVDQGSDKISLARADIKQNIDNVNQIIDHLTTTSGQQLMIPLTGFVVTDSTHDGFEDSAGGDRTFYRMALLGGQYYLRNGATEPSLTAAVTSYGAIEGASVNNSTSITKTEPTGLSISTSTTTVSITDGVISSNNSNGDSNASVGSLGATDGYVGYYTGYDSYVTLPAGTYSIEMKTLIDSITDNYSYEPFEDDNSFTPNNNEPDFWIYNKTDGTEITNSAEADNDISEIVNWNKNGQVLFTLADTKDIAFYNPAETYNLDNGSLKLKLTTSVQTTGDFFGSPITVLNPTVDWYDGSNYIPAKLGWVTPIERTFIKITKLS